MRALEPRRNFRHQRPHRAAAEDFDARRHDLPLQSCPVYRAVPAVKARGRRAATSPSLVSARDPIRKRPRRAQRSSPQLPERKAVQDEGQRHGDGDDNRIGLKITGNIRIHRKTPDH
jgi:hypothetical protein